MRLLQISSAILAMLDPMGLAYSGPEEMFSSTTQSPVPVAAQLEISIEEARRGPFSQVEAIKLCKSVDFELRVENWFISEAAEWLENYTQRNRDTDKFRQRGIVGAIAYDYLGESGVRCGTNTSSLCQIDCVTVVKSVEDADEARKVYFVLKSAQHLNLVFDVIRRDLTSAQVNVGLMAPIMADKFHWAEISAYEKTHELLVGYLNVFIQVVISSATAWAPTSSIIAFAENSYEIAKVNCEVLQKDLNEVSLTSYYEVLAKELLDMQRERNFRKEVLDRVIASGPKKSYADERWYQVASPWFGVMAPQIAFDAIGRYTAWEGEEDSVEKNAERLMFHIQATAEATRRKLAEAVNNLFTGLGSDDQGTTDFSKLIGAGGYLPSTSEALAQWVGPEVEDRLTRNLLLKAIDAALASQTIWISCTKEFFTVGAREDSWSEAKYPTTSCRRDKSGPQDTKECVDDLVCYIYKWDSRKQLYPAHRVEYLYGLQDMAEAPFNVPIQDIIYSSVKTYLQNREGKAQSNTLAAFKDAASAEKLWDSREPGMFTVPVCMSDHNWMTPIEPVNKLLCFADLNCRQKNLPCHCGPWGSETKALWKEAGLWDLPDAETYRTAHCPRQIRKRIKDPLEKYLANCHVEIHNDFIKMKHVGANPMCGTIMEQLQAADYPSVAGISPTLKTKLMCTAGIISKKKCRNFGLFN